MKFFNVKLLLAFLVLGLTVFTACEDTTTPTDTNPYITTITPPGGPVGTILTINGTNFGTAADPGSVYFGSVEAHGAPGDSTEDYISWTETQIKVKIPTNSPTGSVKVKVFNGATSLYSNEVSITVGNPPAGPTNATATSKSATEVIVQWTASVATTLSKYNVDVYEGTTFLKTVSTSNATTYTATVGGLTEGTIYTFKVAAVDNNGFVSTDVATIQWSPASRFDGTKTVRMYEIDSDTYGSGIDLWDETAQGPVTKKVAAKSTWNIGLYAKGTQLLFQSGNEIQAGTGTAQATYIADAYYFENTLDGTLDNLSLDNILNGKGNKTEYLQRSFDLNDNNYFDGNTVVFVVRTKEADNKTHYAKVLVKAVGGKYLQGTAPDRYVECEISYQKVGDVPYARTIQ